MKATYQAPSLQDEGSFREQTGLDWGGGFGHASWSFGWGWGWGRHGWGWSHWV